VQSVVPQFLSASFEMLRDGQSKLMENMEKMNPMGAMPGFEAMRAQQEMFFKAMTGNIPATWSGPSSEGGDTPKPATDEDLDTIKRELAELQQKLAKMGK
jgi:polyhydroxyalkanoate synthesis regulator protein